MLKNTLYSLTILMLAGCATADNPAQTAEIGNMASVDVTSNPEVVKGCKRLGSVDLGRYTGRHSGSAPTLSQSPLEYLRLQAHDLGGNVLFTVNDQSGDAYICTTAAEASAAQATVIDLGPTRAAVVTKADGCKYVGEVDLMTACPSRESGHDACLAYRATYAGGNAVVAKPNNGGSVYLCPAPGTAAK